MNCSDVYLKAILILYIPLFYSPHRGLRLFWGKPTPSKHPRRSRTSPSSAKSTTPTAVSNAVSTDGSSSTTPQRPHSSSTTPTTGPGSLLVQLKVRGQGQGQRGHLSVNREEGEEDGRALETALVPAQQNLRTDWSLKIMWSQYHPGSDPGDTSFQ